MKKPLCRLCRHRLDRHTERGCEAEYSAGPSGSFQCHCNRKPPKKKPKI